MTEHHHCTCTSYADRARQETVAVEENVQVARDTYRVRFACEQIAEGIVPGQFIMVRLAGVNDPLLGRPLAMYNVVPDESGRPQQLEIVYRVVGKMTRRLSVLEPGALLEVWGPLGNGFPPTETEHLVMVAGGIGQTPLLSLAKKYLHRQTYGSPPRQVRQAKKVTLCYGAGSGEYLACVEDFKRAGVEVHISTDDGSAGHRGLVTELIRPVVESSDHSCRIVCCGPEPMMEATAQLAGELRLRCQVSLERSMACGLGICFSCVAKIRDASGRWDYRRTCVEGPVFEAEDVEF